MIEQEKLSREEVLKNSDFQNWEEILKRINEKDDFIIALALHELYHIWNRIMVNSEEEAIMSENLVHYELGKDFPEYAKLLY